MNQQRQTQASTPARRSALAATQDAGSLEALLESAKLLHSSLELDDLLRSLLRSVMGRLLVSRGVIALESTEGGGPRVAVSRGLKDLAAGTDFDPLTVGEQGVDLLLPIGDPLPTGYLGLGQPLTGTLGAKERAFLEALLGIAASAIDNARSHSQAQALNRLLDRRVQQLRTLLDLVRSLSSALDPEQVAHVLGLTLAGQWLVGKYSVIAWKSGHPTVERQRGMRFGDGRAHRPALEELGGPARLEDLEDGTLKAAVQAQGGVLVVPLLSGASALGFAVLGRPAGEGGFQDEDLEFCAGLGAQAVVAFENAWFVVETVEKQKLERDLALAAEIQTRLFPTALPQLPGLELAAKNRPAAQVGGDYYDVVPVPSEGAAEADGTQRHLICVADVSGKGMAASLLMSNMQATLHALLHPRVDLAALVTRANQLLFAATPGNKYVTAIFLLVEPETGACTYVNAGHNEGILVRADGTEERLTPGGTPVGLLGPAVYTEGQLNLHPGDLIALYSDGVNEANDTDENEFSTRKLVTTLQELRAKSATEVVEGVFASVDAFVGDAPQYDDITLLTLKRTV